VRKHVRTPPRRNVVPTESIAMANMLATSRGLCRHYSWHWDVASMCGYIREVHNQSYPPHLPRIEDLGGDLGGILRWGCFLNASRLLKDFRKM
jgi:hypothetical protein